MIRRWPRMVPAAFVFWASGCALPAHRPTDAPIERARLRPPGPLRPATPPDLAPTPPDLIGPQPVDAYIRRALGENRMVQAAHFNVMAMKARIPQVTALDDPVASNVIYPIPSVAPQYSLMGYNPYNLTLAQQFPWFGTLRLRGEAAEFDVKVALAELAAAQLDTVANVKRAYYDLHYNERAEAILADNRKLAADFVTIAKSRYAGGNSTQQDVLRAEVAVVDLDRELIRIRQGIAEARADLAQQLHISPEAELRTLPGLPATPVPVEVDRLYRLAVAARPELKGRLAAIARDEKAVELARKRFYPNYTLGLSYMDMEKTNAQTPKTAGGFPNVGLFVGFNLPVYRSKYKAGVCEAQARAAADARLYDAERGRGQPRGQEPPDPVQGGAGRPRALRRQHPAAGPPGAGGGHGGLQGRQRRLRHADHRLARGPPGRIADRPGRGGVAQVAGVAGAGRRGADQRPPADPRGRRRGDPRAADGPPAVETRRTQ